MYVPQPKLAILRRKKAESRHYTHFLANVLNNLPDIQILHFKIDVM